MAGELDTHPDDCECFGHRIRHVQFSPSCTPNRRNNIAPKVAENSWEKGVLRDERGIPIRRNGKVIPVKQAAAERHKIEAELRALKQGHNPALIR